VALVRERRVAYMVLVGKTEGERPLGKPRHRWEGNIKMNLSEVSYGVWIELIWVTIRVGDGVL
jgi:hypothetical protein